MMLLGHSDSYHRDKIMQVTIAFNHFGEGLIQRMPRFAFFSYWSNCKKFDDHAIFMLLLALFSGAGMATSM